MLILRRPVNNQDTLPLPSPSETLNTLKTHISATRHVMISLNLHILRMGTGAIKVRIVKQHLLSIHEPGASSQLVKGQRVKHPHGPSRNTGMVQYLQRYRFPELEIKRVLGLSESSRIMGTFSVTTTTRILA